MALIHLIEATPEIARRRSALPAGTLVEAWPDLTEPSGAWVGDEAKRLLDSLGPPIPAKLSVNGDLIRIYYGPRLSDVGSLPREESLRARVLSAHGVAVAWVTIDEHGERTAPEVEAPSDPTFYLRRPRGDAAHLWRLFRARREAVAFMETRFADDAEARQWARDLPVEDFLSLMTRSSSDLRDPGPSR
jgi:hypothetical protein